MRFISAGMVEEPEETTLYLDNDFGEIFTDSPQAKLVTKSVSNDPFEKVNIHKQSRKIKRKFNTLQKRYQGIDGTSTKYEDPEQVTGYGVFGVVIPPYDLDALGALYEENPILRAVIETRAMNTVGTGYSWVPTQKAQKRTARALEPDRAEKIRAEHVKESLRLENLLEDFNEDETFTETCIKVWTDALTFGTGYLEIGRNRSGKIGYVGHIPSKFMRIRKDRDGFVQLTNSSTRAIFFRNFGDLETADPISEDPNPNEIIAVKIFSPNSSYYGIPPSTSAIAAIIGDKFAKEYNIDFFENKAVPRYAVIIKGVKLSNTSKKELIAYFKNEVKGKNHGTLVIPLPASIGGKEADIEFKELETKIQDASFENYRKANRDEIIIAYRVPPTKVGVLDNANLAVSRDADKTFKIQTIGPDQTIFQKKVNKIVDEFSDLFQLRFNQIDIIDEDLQSRIFDRMVRVEALTPNEFRESMPMDLPPLPTGDEVLPYPVKAALQQSEMDVKFKEKQLKQTAETAKMTAQAGAGKPGGGQIGNSNSGGLNPKKSGQDNGTNRSSAVATGTNKEKGQGQDTSGVKEKK